MPIAPPGVFYWRRQTDFEASCSHAAHCLWYEARDDIEKQLRLDRPARTANKQILANSCVVGYFYKVDSDGKPRNLAVIPEHHRMAPADQVLIRILPKQAVSPPKMRRQATPPPPEPSPPELPPEADEMERLRALIQSTSGAERQPHWARLPVERVGDAPPEWYVCKNCSSRGHFIRNCPWKGGGREAQRQAAAARPLRPCGIPRCHLRAASEEEKAAGRVFVDSDGHTYSLDHSISLPNKRQRSAPRVAAKRRRS